MSNKNILKLIAFTSVILLIYFAYFNFEIGEYLSLENLRVFIGNFGILAPLAFIVIYITLSLVFIPASFLTVLAGILFGKLYGVFYVVFAATIAAQIAFFVSKKLGKNLIKKLSKKNIREIILKIEEKVQKNTFKTFFILRCLFLPYIALSYAGGFISSANGKDFLLATLITNIIFTPAFVFLGDSFLSEPKAFIFSAILILIIFLIPMFIKKFKKLDKNEFDIIIIGAGSGGLNIASFMNRAGFKTLLIDKEERGIGGDCLNYGCVPSKALIHIAKMAKDSKKIEKYGIKSEGIIDMKEVKKYVNNAREYIRKHENSDYLSSIGMNTEIGIAKFISKNEIVINDKKFSAKKIIISTGSKPRIPKVPGIENVRYLTNETIFDIENLPEKLLVIGGGPIGIELGQTFNFLGSNVTVIHSGNSILEKEDPKIAKVLFEKMKQDGVKFIFNSRLDSFTGSNTAKIKHKTDNKTRNIEFNSVLIAIGRELDFTSLDLEKANIKQDEKGLIKIDKKLRTSNKNIFVSGDAVGSYQFTHAAELHASVIINNFFSPFKKKISYNNFSWVTYTTPEIATFGLNEIELKKGKIKYEVLESDFQNDDRAIIDDYKNSLLKLFINKKGKILGGSMAAPNAGEIFQELILANSANLKTKDLLFKIYPYPTASRINKSTISKSFSKKLESKLNRKLLKFIYR